MFTNTGDPLKVLLCHRYLDQYSQKSITAASICLATETAGYSVGVRTLACLSGINTKKHAEA